MADNLFEYFNVGDVDPTFSSIPTDTYSLRINKVTPKTIVPSKGKRAGEETPVVDIELVVVDNDKFSGRRLFPRFWLSNGYDQKALRRIADGSGIAQNPGPGTFEPWLAELSAQQPVVKVRVLEVPDYEADRITQKVDPVTGKPMTKNEIDWKGGVFPA